MTQTPLPCFHATSLRTSFTRQLILSRSQGELTQTQFDLFLTLCLNPWQPPAGLRIDSLSASQLRSEEFLDALMISHTDTAEPAVYLSLPLRAIERFADRDALHLALESRYGDGSDISISARRLDISPFEHWMTQLLTRQRAYGEHLDDTLQKLPSLTTVMSEALQTELARLSPATDHDPDAWAWHLSDFTRPETVLQTCSLLDVALDQFCQVALPEGTRLQMMEPQGQLQDPLQRQQYAEALSTVSERLSGPFDQALTRFWQQPDDDQVSRASHAERAWQHLYYMTLIRAEHEASLASAAIESLRAALHSLPAAQSLQLHSVAVYSGLRAEIGLAGLFVLGHPDQSAQGLHLFHPRRGFVHFPGPDANAELTRWLTHLHQQPLLKEAIGTANHAPYAAMKRVQVRLRSITTSVFADRLSSIMALQQQNLAQAIAQRAGEPGQVAARLDDALDIRGLLAPALLTLEHSPRWAPTPLSPTVTSKAPASTFSAPQVSDLRERFSAIQHAQPGLGSCLRYLVARQLALMGLSSFNADNVWITSGSGSQRVRQSLLAHAVAQLQRTPVAPLADDCDITNNQAVPIDALDASLLNAVLEVIAHTARALWLRQFNRYDSQPTRVGAQVIDAHRQRLMLRQHALRIELALLRDAYPEPAWAQAWLRQVLDRPTRAMRHGLGDDAVEVNRVSLQAPGDSYAITLDNVMALTLELQPAGQVLFCSPLLGAVAFASTEKFTAELLRLMREPAAREQWLTLVAERFQTTLAEQLADNTPLSVALAPIDGDYAQYLQRGDENRQVFNAQAALKRALRARYPWDLTLAYVDGHAVPAALDRQLDELASSLKAAAVKNTLPSWIDTATTTDLRLYLANLHRVRDSIEAPQNYLFGIQSAMEYASEQTATYLTLDFPTDFLDPTQVRVRVAQKFPTGLHFSAASAGMIGAGGVVYPALDMSLVEYSLQRAIAVPDMPIELSMSDGSAVIDGLTPAYVMEMAKVLDTGGHYRRQLERTLDSSDEQYAKRRRLFHQQVPGLLMDVAIEAKLKGDLGAEAFALVRSVLEMPDTVARKMQEGHNYRISPLSLLAADGLAPDTAAGLYLLRASEEDSTPLVLMATFNEAFMFREYHDQADFMAHLRSAGDLQTLVLERVATAVRARYTHGGLTVANLNVSAGAPFEQPMPKAQQTRLAYQPVEGNTIDYLFEQSLKFLLRLAKAQVVTSAEADHAANVNLLKLLIETGLTFVNGRVALVLALWQSADWLKAAANALLVKEWGKGVSQLSAALLLLMSHRTPRQERLTLDFQKPELPTVIPEPLVSRFKDIPLQARERLRNLEANDVTLSDLTPGTVSGFFLDIRTQRHYAPVAGLVFEIRKINTRWTIVRGAQVGPALRQDAYFKWQIDFGLGLAGGGIGWSAQQRASNLQLAIDSEFMTEATGLVELRNKYPLYADRVAEAQLRAKSYLELALDALTTASGQQAAGVPGQAVLQDFFGVASPSDALIAHVRDMTAGIYAELMDASLNTRTSMRYIAGLNRAGYEKTVAFTDPEDPQRRIFLTNVFFNVPGVLHKMVRTSQKHFDAPEHFRATTLIHELSHSVHRTGDLAYIEASAPYLDMIDATTPKGQKLVKSITLLRTETLSANSPPDKLFTTVENGVRRDLDDTDGDIRKHILRVSKQKTLKAARVAFVTDELVRRDIILANADSVALLITLLARAAPPLP